MLKKKKKLKRVDIVFFIFFLLPTMVELSFEIEIVVNFGISNQGNGVVSSNLATQLPIKLTSKNYLSWHA